MKDRWSHIRFSNTDVGSFGCTEKIGSAPIMMGLALFAQMQIIRPYPRNGGNHFAEINRFTNKKGGTLHALTCCLAMIRHYMKTGVVSLLTFVLLYYSVAWVVLSCFHEEDNGHHPAIISVNDALDGNTYLPFPRHAHVNVDCLDSDYHTESLAGPSSSTQLSARVAPTVSHGINDLTLALAARARWLWLKAAFDRFPANGFLIDLPRYLSFSVLRI